MNVASAYDCGRRQFETRFPIAPFVDRSKAADTSWSAAEAPARREASTAEDDFGGAAVACSPPADPPRHFHFHRTTILRNCGRSSKRS
jgi:hypothetical protein